MVTWPAARSGLAIASIRWSQRPQDRRATRPRVLLERTIQLQTALDSRIVIEQAKGILAERHGITPDDAFTRLRRDARSRRMKLHNVAAEVIRTTRNG